MLDVARYIIKTQENGPFSIAQRQLHLDKGCREGQLGQDWNGQGWGLWVPGSVQPSWGAGGFAVPHQAMLCWATMAQPIPYQTVPCHTVLVLPYRLMLGYTGLIAPATSLVGGEVTGGGRAAPGVANCASGKAPMGQHGHFSAADKSVWLAPHCSYLCYFLLSHWWLSTPSLDFPLS